MFLNFPNEFGIFCLFEVHVKYSSGLNFLSLDSDFFREKVPGDFFLRFGRRYFLAVNSARLTVDSCG